MATTVRNETAASTSKSADPIRVALLGCGVVGTEVVRLITTQRADLTARVGAPLELVGIAVHNLDRERDPVVDRELLTDDAEDLVTQADIVIELMGGTGRANDLIHQAIDHGAAVVTANKELLAKSSEQLENAADAAGVDLYFEAAVAGTIPIIRPVRESLAGDKIERVLGIVNGTTNYVLDQMTKTNADFDEVVAEAQELGYAEADPTADIEGYDAAAKAAILASLAFHTKVTSADVSRQGITEVTAEDVAWAQETNHVIKLLAIAERRATNGGDAVSVRVHPALIPDTHPLATIDGAFNAVFIEAAAAGPLMFYGQGAGGVPTASAVLGDLVTAARHRLNGGKGPNRSDYSQIPVLPPGKVRTRFQMRLHVNDKRGVLARVAQTLAENRISIERVWQIPEPLDLTDQPEPLDAVDPLGSISDQDEEEQPAVVVVTTHEAAEADLQRTIATLKDLEVVSEVVSVLRVEGV